MGNELETPRQRAGHVGGRAFLLAVAGIAAVAGALGLMYLAWVTENHFTRSFQFEAPVALTASTWLSSISSIAS